MWQVDFSWEGFSWISNDDYNQSVIAFRRIDKDGNDLIAVCNFVPVQRENYCIGVPTAGIYTELFNSDDVEFGGGGVTNGDTIKSVPEPMHGFEDSISLTLPAMSVLYLKCRRRIPHKKKTVVKPVKAAEKEKKAEKEPAAIKAEAKPKTKKTSPRKNKTEKS